MPELKGSKTEQNLRTAFSGESEARNKYTYFAGVAKKEGYEQIAAIFQETANNEMAHAKLWFKHLNGLGDTKANLKSAAAGEHHEWTEMYKEFAATAREEGFDKIAAQMELIAEIEKHHENRYLKLLENIENDTAFKRDTKQRWICLNCGHIHESESAPQVCPACVHPQSFFQVYADNY
ncbi:MAG: rubrerythrin family protein [Defluviitaleaceae bacterium]|nr:rubrerythrin family protein [Defluviitaleaceae bacterium]